MTSIVKHALSRLLITALLIAGLAPIAYAAPNAALSFGASVTSTTVGSDIRITVNVSVSEFAAGSIRVKLKYDPALLEYLSVDENGSVFDTKLGNPTNDASAGTITLSRGKTGPGVTGQGKVIDVLFKSKNSGSTQVGFESDSKIWESGTGDEKPLDTSAKVSLAFASASSSTSGSAPATSPTPSPTQKTSTATPRSRTTATPKPTTATPAPTPTPTITTTPSSTTISPTQSIVTVSKTSAVADGVDPVTVTVTVKAEDGTVITDVTPTMVGLRDGSDTATAFTFDPTTQTWSSNIVSTAVGAIVITVSAGDIALASTDLTFTEAAPAGTTQTSESGGTSFGTVIAIGLIFLLLLMLLLFFLWRRLKSHDEDDFGGQEPAFPGDETVEPEPIQEPELPEPSAPPAPPAPPNQDEEASFNQSSVLQRHEPPPPPPAEEKQTNQDDDSIPV